MTPDEQPMQWSTRQKVTLVATGLGLFMVFLDVLIVNIALPDIQKSYGVGEAGIQWVVAAYSIGMAIFMMTSATLADHFGRRRMYIVGMAVFAVASMVCGLAPSIDILNVARGVQGLSAAMVNVTSLALVSAAFPDPKQKAKAVGLWTAIASLAMAIGPTMGGVLTQTVGWRAVFYVNVPFVVLAIVLTARYVAEPRDPKPRGFDLPGQILFIVGIGAVAFALIQGQQLGWGSPMIVACFATSVISLTVFAIWELRTRVPMMDLRLFANRTYTVAIVTIFFQFFSVYGMMLLTTQYFQSVRGFSPILAGALILPFSFSIMILSPVAGNLAARLGPRTPVVLGQSALLIGLVLICIGLGQGAALVVVGLGFVGTGGALTITPITSLAMTSVPVERSGMASGIMSAQRAIGSTAGYSIMGAILAVWLSASVAHHLEPVIADPVARTTVANKIVKEATPHALRAEVGPGRPLAGDSAAQRAAIRAAVDQDFERGMQIAISFAIGVTVIAWCLSFFGLPRGRSAVVGAEREAERIEAAEGG